MSFFPVAATLKAGFHPHLPFHLFQYLYNWFPSAEVSGIGYVFCLDSDSRVSVDWIRPVEA